ncbi:hypothetical protein Pan241w_27340 [Gimesia alba]|uniref:Uncharacterized protein n=1 Tax=Gimesia alba TaxID=2527973 RepID=A0A517RFJ6_9PLAN|nr:CHAP domain-containing protein [Gimesia alba]QDT42647.1 hypothetical protein Pan241w_27340 [Gimesia alba]
MFRYGTLLASFMLIAATWGMNDVAWAQSIQVRFSPLSKTSSIQPADFLYHIRTDSITPEARRKQLDQEKKSYGPILDSGKCVRKQGPATEQDCVGLVTEWLYWGGDLSARNRIAELRGGGADQFYQNFLKRFCTKQSGESASRKGDIVAFLKDYPNGTSKCLHVALVTDGGKILSKDADGSVFLISGGNDSLKVPFKGFNFEYWRPKEKLRAEMLYDFQGREKSKAKPILAGWQPVNAKRVKGRYYLPEELAQVMKLFSKPDTLEFIANKNGSDFVVNDKSFVDQIQGVFDVLKKANPQKGQSDDNMTINQMKLTISGSRNEWKVTGNVNVTYTTVEKGKKKEKTEDYPIKAVAKPHQK